MKKIFRFLAKRESTALALVPQVLPALDLSTPSHLEEADELPIERQVRDLLWQYELAEQHRQKLREENPELFDKLEQIDAQQHDVRESMKRLLHTKAGPPDVVRPGASSHTWAKGDMFKVEVTYKKRSNYYDPNLLPKSVFMLPGIVVEVDKSKLDALSKKDGRIARALVHGGWMTPAVSLPRVTRDD